MRSGYYGGDVTMSHIIDKDNTLKALRSVNTLLSQSLQVIKSVNKDEQWDSSTCPDLYEQINAIETLVKEISKTIC